MGIKNKARRKEWETCRSAGLFGIVCGFFRQLGRADLIIEEQVVRPHPQAGRQVFLYIESVFRVEIRKVLIIRVLRNIVLSGQEGPDAAHLQQTLPAIHHSQLVHGHQIFATKSSDKFNLSNFHKCKIIFFVYKINIAQIKKL